MDGGPEGHEHEDPVALLLAAWSSGCFPMADGRHGRVSFYTADPRGVIPLDDGGLIVSRSLRSLVRRSVEGGAGFRVTCDAAFERVIRLCADLPREGQWINDWIIHNYLRLHALGHAHSVEAWWTDPHGTRQLAGGLYGLHIGGVFFGESMVTRPEKWASGASKVCLVHLWHHLRRRGFVLFDTQAVNPHTATLGAIDLSRAAFERTLRGALRRRVDWGDWKGVERGFEDQR